MHHSKMRQPGVRPWLHLDQNVRIPKSFPPVHGILPLPIFVGMACANNTMLPRKSQETLSIQENLSTVLHHAAQAGNNGSLHSGRFCWKSRDRIFLRIATAMATHTATTKTCTATTKTWGLFNESSWGGQSSVLQTCASSNCIVATTLYLSILATQGGNMRKLHLQMEEKKYWRSDPHHQKSAQACVVPTYNQLMKVRKLCAENPQPG